MQILNAIVMKTFMQNKDKAFWPLAVFQGTPKWLEHYKDATKHEILPVLITFKQHFCQHTLMVSG